MTATASASHFAEFESMVLKEHEPTLVPMGLQTWLIFGEYGSGKSTLAAQFEDAVYYDIEYGAANIKHTPVPGLTNTWKSFKSFVDGMMAHVKAGKKLPFKTLVIDTADNLVDLCIKSVWADNGWTAADQGDRGAGWTEPRLEFRRVVEKLMLLHKHGHLGTVFLAHEETEEVKVGLTYSANVAIPKIRDKDIKVWLPSQCQIVIRAAKTNVNPMDASDVWNTRKFILQTKAGEAAAAVKDRTDRLPAYLMTNYDALKAAYYKNETKDN